MNENLVLNPSDQSDESEVEEPAEPKQSKATNKGKKVQETDVEPERTQESWVDRRNKGPRNLSQETSLHSLGRIPYGGTIKMKGSTVHLHNTCNIGNMLQTFYSLHKLDQDTSSYIQQLQQDQYNNPANIISVFRHMSDSNWVTVRQITLIAIMELKTADLQSGDLMASERFLAKIAHFIPVMQIYHCNNKKCRGKKKSGLSPMKDIVISSPKDLQDIINDWTVEQMCCVRISQCKSYV
jgi:hypothetical protein